jgi:exonuclease SbcD
VRLLHTGDWHVGRRLHGRERIGEQRAVLAELAELAATERVDATLVAGDLLDRRLLDPAALTACLDGLDALARVAPVVAVTGNHDDPELWSRLAPYLEGAGIVVAGRPLPPAEAVRSLDLGAGTLHVACLPWLDAWRLQSEAGIAGAEARGRYAEQAAGVIGAYAAELRARRAEGGGAAVLLAHLMVDQARTGGGERELTLGITYAVTRSALPTDLDYLALGHVHRPQSVPGLAAPGRYAGSPIALDFSEAGLAPSAVIVEIEGGDTTTREAPLSAGRPLVTIRGPLEALGDLAAAHPDALFRCEVELEEVRPDLGRAAREQVPDAIRIDPVYPAVEEEAGSAAADDSEATLPELYAEWHEALGRPLDPRQAAAFAEALASAEGDE